MKLCTLFSVFIMAWNKIFEVCASKQFFSRVRQQWHFAFIFAHCFGFLSIFLMRTFHVSNHVLFICSFSLYSLFLFCSLLNSSLLFFSLSLFHSSLFSFFFSSSFALYPSLSVCSFVCLSACVCVL